MSGVVPPTPCVSGGPLVVLGMNQYATQALKANAERCVLVIAAKHRPAIEPELLARLRTIVVSSLDSVDEIVCALARSEHGPFSAIWTNREDSVVTTSLVGRALGLEALPLEVATVFRDKFAQKERLAGTVRVADVRLVDDAWFAGNRQVRDAKLPLVVKPVAGTATRGIRVARSEDELRAAVDDVLTRSGVALCESFVECDDELHLDGVVRNGHLEGLMVSTYGTSALAIRSGLLLGRMVLDATAFAPSYDLAAAWVSDVVSRLGLTDGVFHVEAFARVVDRQVVDLTFGEAAARVGGADIPLSFRDTVGRDLFGAALGAALGSRPAGSLATSRSATCSLWLPSLPEDDAALLARLLDGRPGRPHLVHTAPRVVTGAMRSDTNVFGAILRCSDATSRGARAAALDAVRLLRSELGWDFASTGFTTDRSRLLGTPDDLPAGGLLRAGAI